MIGINKEENGYRIGYIGVIDILGFGFFTEDEEHFQRILNAMNRIYVQKRNFERNFEIKYLILSDTVVVMVEANNEAKFDYVYLESVICNIGYIRSYILNNTGLYSRAAITFGKYYYNEERGIIFGPAITRAAKLAEQADRFIPEKEDERFKERPAAIIVDEVFTKKTDNPFYVLFYDGCVYEDCLSGYRFKRIGNTDFFLYNPYYESFDDYYYTSISETYYDEITLFECFCSREEDRLSFQIDHVDETKNKKYKIEKDLLKEFATNFLNQHDVVVR